MIDDEIPTRHIGKRSKVNMPEISAQGKTSDPFRTVNCSIRPFVGNRRIEERVSTQEEPSASSWRRQSLRIVKKTGGGKNNSVPAGVRSGSVGARNASL